MACAAAQIFLGSALLLVTQTALAEAPRADLLWTTGRMADASDRAYEPTAIALIDGARSSVALAMYAIQEGEDARHPVTRLLNDLVEAARRGVRVEVYLNTRFAGRDDSVVAAPWVARLRQAGGTVTAFRGGQRWHGKLLIVDERYILEGSANWSVAALKSNGESNTVMDAPALARQKLAHLRAWGAPNPAERRTMPPTDNPFLEAGPETLTLPQAWLAPDGLFSQCVTRGDERGCDALMLLIRRSAAEDAREFAVDFDGFSDALALSPRWSRTHRRQEILQVLRRLSRWTGVVAVQHHPYRESWVRLTVPEGPTVALRAGLTAPEVLTRRSAEAVYLAVLTEVVRAREGLDLTTAPYDELVRRTGLTPRVLRRARRELGIPPRRLRVSKP